VKLMIASLASHLRLPAVTATLVMFIAVALCSRAGLADDAANADATVKAIMALEADIEYGEYLAGEGTTCHNDQQQIGKKGDGGVPGIHGADRQSIVLNMLAYRSGERVNTTMRGVAQAKADDEIAALAAYFSSLASTAPVSMHNQHAHHSAYAGQQDRAIKSLSDDDIAELKAGAGWGLAKVAELNGVPGPVHLLEMKNEIALKPAQVTALETLYTQMNTRAVELGEQLISKEQALEQRFRSDIPSTAELKQLLDEIGSIRSALRFVHLAAHLKTPDILTPHQVVQYNQLRGYASGDPCDSVPEGHNEKMWKRHNNCN